MNYITGKTSFGVMAPSAVSLGKFDGLHRGHQKLLQHILEQKWSGGNDLYLCQQSDPYAVRFVCTEYSDQ